MSAETPEVSLAQELIVSGVYRISIQTIQGLVKRYWSKRAKEEKRG